MRVLNYNSLYWAHLYFIRSILYYNFCSVAITFLKAIAKTKFAKISNKAEVKELAASNWISTTCRDIQTAIIKTCAYNNRFALKCAFGESYNDLYQYPVGKKCAIGGKYRLA